MTRQNNLGTDAGKSRRQNGGPIIPAMMSMNDLNPLAANHPGRAQNKAQFQRTFRGSGLEGNAQTAQHARKLPPSRASDPNALTQLSQTGSQLGALIIRAATPE